MFGVKLAMVAYGRVVAYKGSRSAVVRTSWYGAHVGQSAGAVIRKICSRANDFEIACGEPSPPLAPCERLTWARHYITKCQDILCILRTSSLESPAAVLPSSSTNEGREGMP
eukprot:1142284-Pyramimonas_sp.AAC.1